MAAISAEIMKVGKLKGYFPQDAKMSLYCNYMSYTFVLKFANNLYFY